MRTDRQETATGILETPPSDASTSAQGPDSLMDMDLVRQREVARLDIATQITRLRQRAGLSQAALAERIGTKQAAIARMERRDYRGYTVGTLAKIAAATGARLEVRLAPALRPARRRLIRKPSPEARQRTPGGN